MSKKNRRDFTDENLTLFNRALEEDIEAQSDFYKMLEPTLLDAANFKMQKFFGRADYEGVTSEHLSNISFHISLKQAIEYRRTTPKRMEHPNQFIALYSKVLNSQAIDSLRAHGPRTSRGVNRNKPKTFTDLNPEEPFEKALEGARGTGYSDKEKIGLVDKTLGEIVAFIDSHILPHLGEKREAFEKKYMSGGEQTFNLSDVSRAKIKILGDPEKPESENISLVPKNHKYRSFFEQLLAKKSPLAAYFCPLRDYKNLYTSHNSAACRG